MGKSPKICIVGAGFSGICMAIKLKETLGINSFTIFEGCEEVGGTWLVNTYPGCACDVPSHLYSFSFFPKHDWSHAYSPQPEILEYTKQVTKKYGIYPHIRFQTRVESLRWNEHESKWHASILDVKKHKLESDDFDIIINGTGKIRIPHYPEEYLGFTGPIIHSAQWDHSVSLEGKSVGIIGTGASAVQIITAVANKVETLTVFQRKAPYIFPLYQVEYSKASKRAFSSIPGLYKLSRNAIFLIHEIFYAATRYNSIGNKIGTKFSKWYRNREVKDVELRKKITPTYPLGCKRIILSESYYKTLTLPNVDLVTDKIESVSGKVVKIAGNKKVELDVLILATGYQPHDFFSPMRVYGKDGVDILEEWKKERPQAYMGIMSSNMPNFFTLLGPYSAVGHSSNLFNIECQVHWTILAIKALQEKDDKATSINLKQKYEEEFIKYVDRMMVNSVWMMGQCEPWYLDKQGRNTTLWPSHQIEYWNRCKTLDTSMFDFV